MKKYMQVLLLAMVLMLIVLPVRTKAATTLTSPATNLTAVADGSFDSGNTSASTGSVTMKVKGDKWSDKTATLTLTNGGDKVATLSFSYSVTGSYNAFTIAGDSVGASGSYTAELGAGANVVISVKINSSGLFASAGQATLTLSNVKLEIPQDANVTITHNGAGSVSAGGSTVASGSTIAVPATGTTLTATPGSDATFVAWVNAADNSVVSESASFAYKPSGDVSLKAVFASPTTVAPFWGSNKAYLFGDLNAAITHASSASNKVITLAGNGTLPSGNYIIPSGVTLVIPFDSAGTYYTSTPGCDESNWTKPTPYYTLTMKSGAHIIVNGAISVSAKVTAKMGYSGNPTSKYGHVAMNEGSTITVNDKANLYAWGYITGSGKVTIKGGGTVYEAFQVTDWRGGTYTTKMLDNSNKVFPMTQYYAQNVEVPMTLEAGAKETCSMAAVISSFLQQKEVPFFGESDSMFNITGGSATKRYDGSTDRLIFDVNGDFNVSNITIKMSDGILGFGKVYIESAKYVLPVSNNITLNINKGSKMTVNQTLSLLPGTQVNIAEGATLELASGKQLFVYDEAEWKDKGYVYYSTGLTDFVPVVFAPSKSYDRTKAADMVDVQLMVNGTLDASAGYLYTTAGGSNIYSTGTGKVKLQAPQSAPTLYETSQKTDAPEYVSIPITAAQLKNKDNTYAGPVTEKADYLYVNGFWHKDGKCSGGIATCFEQATCEVCGEKYGELMPHTYGEAEYKWADGYSSCEISITCSVCPEETDGHVLKDTDSEVEIETVDGTCQKEAETIYKASVELNEKTYEKTETVKGEKDATKHTNIALNGKVDKTCTENGYTGDTVCSDCGATVETGSTIESQGHTPGAEATCTTVQTCTVCGAELTAALGHNMVAGETVSPTCTSEGYTSYTCANGCGKTEKRDAVAANSHNYTAEITTSAGCEAAGVKTFTCANCGDSYTEVIPALNHKDDDKDHVCDNGCGVEQGTCADSEADQDHVCDYGCGAVLEECADVDNDSDHSCDVCGKENVTEHVYTEAVTPPTCTEDGFTTYTCNCGHTYTDNPVEARHSIAQGAAQEKTCTQAGWEAYEYCTKCSYSTKVVIPAGHTLKFVEEKAASCTEAGNLAHWLCDVCGKCFPDEQAQEEIADVTVTATNHANAKTINASEATCGEDGYTGDTYCEDCGTTIATGTSIPATGAHEYDEGVVTQEPTATVPGVMTYTCGTCGDSYTEEIPATGVQLEIIIHDVPKKETNGIEVKAEAENGVMTVVTRNSDNSVVSAKYVHLIKCTLDNGSVETLKNTSGNHLDGTYAIPEGAVSVEIESAMLGDVDMDGAIGASDAAQTLRYALAIASANELQTLVAEVDGDKAIGASDAAKMLRVALAIDDGFYV